MNRFTNALSLVWLACLLCVSGAPAIAAQAAYTLDPGHTQVQFNWSHLGFSNPGASFDDISGTLLWDAAEVSKSSVKVSMSVESVHSHVRQLDQKLRSAEFFDAAKFPKITFNSTKVERTAASNMLKVTGDLTVHGVTKPVVLEVRLNNAGNHPMLKIPAIGFDAATTFKRSDFGVAGGVPMVGDEIFVRITAEALDAEGFAKARKAMSGNSRQK